MQLWQLVLVFSSVGAYTISVVPKGFRISCTRQGEQTAHFRTLLERVWTQRELNCGRAGNELDFDAERVCLSLEGVDRCFQLPVNNCLYSYTSCTVDYILLFLKLFSFQRLFFFSIFWFLLRTVVSWLGFYVRLKFVETIVLGMMRKTLDVLILKRIFKSATDVKGVSSEVSKEVNKVLEVQQESV